MCDAGIIYCKCEMIYKFLECAGSLRVHNVHPRRFEHSLEASYRSRGHVSECAKVGAMHRTATASIGISKVIQGGKSRRRATCVGRISRKTDRRTSSGLLKREVLALF